MDITEREVCYQCGRLLDDGGTFLGKHLADYRDRLICDDCAEVYGCECCPLGYVEILYEWIDPSPQSGP